MKTKFLVLLLSLALVAAACNKKAGNTNQPVQTGTVEISATNQGFVPNNVTIKKGSTVKFINNSSKDIWPASTPHPTHTDYPGFDPKQSIVPGQTWSFTFDQVGTWGLHDHLNPARRGTITVVE